MSDIVKAVACGAGAPASQGAAGGSGSGKPAPRGVCRPPVWDRASAEAPADFGTYVHEFYARIETPDPAAYREYLFREFAEARLLPELASDRQAAAGGALGGGGSGRRTVAFVAPPLTEAMFAGGIASVNSKVPGSETMFVARLI